MAAGNSETQGKLAAGFSSKCNVRKGNKKFMSTLKAKMDEILRNNTEATSGIDSVHALSKSSDDAKHYLGLGARLFKKKDYRGSIIKYTECISAAPADCKHLALAYAGRSAALFHLRKYEASLLDANRAIREGCPKNMTKLLRRRRVDCLKGRREEGVEDSEISIDASDPADLRRAKNLTDSERRVFIADRIFESQNPLLPDTSSKIELLFDEENHPKLVAKVDIEAGDFLSIEEFVVMGLDIKKRIYRCAYCLGRCDILIPCPSCSWMMYCCDFCRSEADKRFHRTECQLLQFYTQDGDDDRNMIALRVFFMATNQGQGLVDLMKKLKFDDIFRKNPGSPKVPYVNDYFSKFDVMKAKKLLDDECLFNIIEELLPMAIKAIVALRSISFFGRTSQPKSLNEIEQFSTLLLVKNYILSWTFSIYAQTMKSTREEHRIGSGVNFVHNFFIYSCNPNTGAFIEGRHRVAYATRLIKAGEQLYYNYRHVYMYSSSEERKEAFAKRKKFCLCEACSNQWPSAVGFRTREIEYLNDSTGAALTKSMYGLMKDNDLETDADIFHTLITLSELLCNSLKMPSFEIFMCEQLLVRCINTFYSDFHWSHDPGLKEEFIRTFRMIVQRLNAGKNQIQRVTEI